MRRPIPWISSGCTTDCSIVIAGLSDACGSWKTICISRRTERSSRSDSFVISRPSKRTLPSVACTRPEQRSAEGRLPAARLADEAEHLALPEVERHVVDRLDVSRLASEEPLPRSCRGSSSTSSGPGSRRAGRRCVDASGFVGNRNLLTLELGASPPPGICSSGPCSQQSTRRPPSSVCSIGCFVAQTTIALGQRGWNRHAGGGSIRSGGAPGIEWSSVVSSEIVERKQLARVRMRRVARTRGAHPPPRRSCPRT